MVDVPVGYKRFVASDECKEQKVTQKDKKSFFVSIFS